MSVSFDTVIHGGTLVTHYTTEKSDIGISEGKITALAEVLGEDQDVLLAMAGKVSSDLLKVIKDRPALFAELIRRLKSEPDHAVLRIVREVRDGDW